MKTSDNSEQEQGDILPSDGAEERVRKEIESLLEQVEVLGQRWREVLDFIPVAAEEKILAGEIEADFLYVARTHLEKAQREHLELLTGVLRRLLRVSAMAASPPSAGE